MQDLPLEIYPLAAVREMDRAAIDDEGIPGYTLMTRAGEAVVREAIRRYPNARRWQVVCGAGNNGGDGYVVARLAAAEGIAATVLALVEPGSLSGDAARAYRDFAAAGGVVIPHAEGLDPEAELLVDAMLGSGLAREVDGRFAEAVAAINAHPAAVVALDVPTGIHGDTGKVMGCAIRADLTVTFVGLKSGLFLGEGAAGTGEIVFAGLGIPEHCRDRAAAVLQRIGRQRIANALPPRPRDAHKGDFGHVLVVGGGPGMPGAVRLCGEAALRAGAGRVSLATDPAHAAAIVAARPELMSHGIASAAALDDWLASADVVAFGPGLGRSEWARDLYERVASAGLPAVWDADALNLLAELGGGNKKRIITPHPGEAGRLLGTSTGEVQSDRLVAVKNLQERYGGIAVLKGAGTLVADGKATPRICTAGNPGMAAPGMGDVLTGIVAGLIAQGLSPVDAAAVGVEAHAAAGDRAARAGERGMTASDLLAELRGVFESLRISMTIDMSIDLSINLPDEAATIAFGARLAEALPPQPAGWTVLLEGELGAGKSTLARALLRCMGHEGPVPSPTYTLVEPYNLPAATVYHIDLYRVSDPDELRYLGFNELDDGFRLIEWPERAPQLLALADLRIRLAYDGDGRRVALEALSARAGAVAERLQAGN